MTKIFIPELTDEQREKIRLNHEYNVRLIMEHGASKAERLMKRIPEDDEAWHLKRLQEVADRHERLAARQFPDMEATITAVTDEVLRRQPHASPEIIREVIERERHFFFPPEVPSDYLDPDFKEFEWSFQINSGAKHLDEIAATMVHRFSEAFIAIFNVFPKTEAAREPSPFIAKSTSRDPRETARAIWSILRLYQENRFFEVLSTDIWKNLQARNVPSTPPHPKDDHILTSEIVETYFAGTPLRPLFDAQAPLPFGDTIRFSHTHIVGGTGAGKTTLLQNMIAHDLKRDTSVIVIEPHKKLIRSLATLDVPRPVVVIDPSDAPGINIFDVQNTDDPVEREKAFASVVKMLSYLFREGDTPPTGKQMMVFQYLCRLMLSLDRPATLITLFEFLENPAPFQADIARLPVISRSFFKDFTDPKSSEYRNTAGQLRYRLHTILSNPALERIFSAEKTEFRIGEEMAKGSLVLIDADQSFLGDMASVFGKIFLALIMEAARERGEQGRPVFLYVDEAHRFLDEHANDLLTDARKFRVGCVFAHQNLGQIHSAELKGALDGAAFKFAGGIRADDASALAREMRAPADFLMTLPKYNFAAFVRDATPSAVRIQPNPEPLAEFGRRQFVRRERPAPLTPVSPPAAPPMSDEY